MRIDFERRGGYGGLTLSYRAELQQLPAAQAGELKRLIEASGLETLSIPKAPPAPPDVMTYRITLQEGARKQSVEVTDITAPLQLRPLLTKLQELAIAARK